MPNELPIPSTLIQGAFVAQKLAQLKALKAEITNYLASGVPGQTAANGQIIRPQISAAEFATLAGPDWTQRIVGAGQVLDGLATATLITPPAH